MGEGAFLTGAFTAQLRLQVTDPRHGVVQPGRRMMLAQYEAALAETQLEWMIDET
jgi:hypothetical protein